MEVSVAVGVLVSVAVSVGTDAIVVVGTGVSVVANELMGVGTSQEDIENRIMITKTMPAKHAQGPFLLFIQLISPLGGGLARYYPDILHNKQL